MYILLLLCLMLIWEILFGIFSKFIRYNTRKFEIIVYSISVLYSVFWGVLATKMYNDQSLKFVFCVGIVQGIFGIIEAISIQGKYKSKELLIDTFRENFCLILTLDWLEKYRNDELEFLQKMNNSMRGNKGNNILVILKDKKTKNVKLMFYVRKQENWKSIEEFCDENCCIELKEENSKKQAIVCRMMIKGIAIEKKTAVIKINDKQKKE